VWRLIGIQPGPQHGGDISGILHVLAPRRVGTVVGMDATIVDLGQVHQESGDRRRGRH